jgi:hypothetical protein
MASGVDASQQDGLHNLIYTDAFRTALADAVASYVGSVVDNDLLSKLRRFLAKGDHNVPRAFSVGIEPGGGRTKILERDPSRVEAIVFNNGSATIFIGDRTVTTGVVNDPSGGIPIPPNTGLVLDNNVGELWAVSTVAAQDVRVLDIAGSL